MGKFQEEQEQNSGDDVLRESWKTHSNSRKVPCKEKHPNYMLSIFGVHYQLMVALLNSSEVRLAVNAGIDLNFCK